MPRHGKKFREAQARVPEGSAFSPTEAVSLVKELSFARFDETVEAAVRLGVDPRHADQIVRGAVVLPHGTGKTARVLVIAQGDKAREAEEAGADFVGTEYVQKIKDGWLDFDVVVATPDMMGQVGQLGRILGPRGLMPTPKAGKIEFRVDRTGNVHVPIGKVSFDGGKLEENLGAFMDTVIRAKPPAAKGQYVRAVTVSSTMGPGVPVDANLFRRA